SAHAQQKPNPTFELAMCNLSDFQGVFVALRHKQDAQKWTVDGWYAIPDGGCTFIGGVFRGKNLQLGRWERWRGSGARRYREYPQNRSIGMHRPRQNVQADIGWFVFGGSSNCKIQINNGPGEPFGPC